MESLAKNEDPLEVGSSPTEEEEMLQSLIDLKEALKEYSAVSHNHTFDLLKSLVQETERRFPSPTSKDLLHVLDERISAIYFLNSVSA